MEITLELPKVLKKLYKSTDLEDLVPIVIFSKEQISDFLTLKVPLTHFSVKKSCWFLVAPLQIILLIAFLFLNFFLLTGLVIPQYQGIIFKQHNNNHNNVQRQNYSVFFMQLKIIVFFIYLTCYNQHIKIKIY